jgi:hypothetical protein
VDFPFLSLHFLLQDQGKPLPESSTARTQWRRCNLRQAAK